MTLNIDWDRDLAVAEGDLPKNVTIGTVTKPAIVDPVNGRMDLLPAGPAERADFIVTLRVDVWGSSIDANDTMTVGSTTYRILDAVQGEAGKALVLFVGGFTE